MMVVFTFHNAKEIWKKKIRQFFSVKDFTYLFGLFCNYSAGDTHNNGRMAVQVIVFLSQNLGQKKNVILQKYSGKIVAKVMCYGLQAWKKKLKRCPLKCPVKYSGEKGTKMFNWFFRQPPGTAGNHKWGMLLVKRVGGGLLDDNGWKGETEKLFTTFK